MQRSGEPELKQRYMNIDIRNLEDDLTGIITSIKKDYNYINTNIDAAKLCIRHHPMHVKEIEELRKELTLMKYKFEKVNGAMKLLGMNPDYEEMERELLDNDQRHRNHFF